MHLSLLAARFRSLTVKRREEAARETETDPLPMVALDFAGLARSENDERTGCTLQENWMLSHGNCVPGGTVFLIVRHFRNEFLRKLM